MNTLESVKEYYGKVLKSKSDLQTSACCTAEAMPAHLRPLLKNVHPEIQDRFYGCGSPIPSELEGRMVLDLGCGTGRDDYLLAQLVGEKGHVHGVDMTEAQLELARRHQDWHAERHGFAKSNVTFHQGYIEDLKSIGIADESIDVITSNCVLNLSPNKERVFHEIWRVLKTGGELYFSDVFADRRIPSALQSDPVLLGECLAGALYIEDFRRLMARVGFTDYRVVSSTPLTLDHSEIERKIGMVNFSSVTVRAFKLPELEDRCEDYGQVAYYLGTISEQPHQFVLDDHHLFKTGLPMLVCSNTAAMVANTRYARHFRVIGDTSTHHGLFDCGPTTALRPSPAAGPAATTGACC